MILLFLKISRINNPDNLNLRQRIQKLDLLGATILIPTVVCLLLALQWGGTTYAWNSSRIIGLFCGFAGLLVIFVGTQLWLGNKGTFPPRVLKNRNVVFALSFAFFFGAGFFALIFYIAIYFQSIKGSSATESGIQLLPLLIATVLSSILTGGLISAVGYYNPFLLVCMALFSIGSGLITTFSLDTPLSKWFGYQVLAGLGIGCGFQGGILVVQNVLPLVDVPIGTAMVQFFQSLGGALLISVAQTVFQNGLVKGLAVNAPSLDPQLFLHSGATSIRGILLAIHKEDQLDAVLRSYSLALSHVFFVTVACSIAAFLSACGLQWKSIKKDKKTDTESTADMTANEKTPEPVIGLA